MNRLDDPPGLMKGRKPSFIGMNGGPETDDQQRLRFQVELEFVQCLANPNYLNFLAQRGYFKDATFVNYLKYLLYWKEPERSTDTVMATLYQTPDEVVAGCGRTNSAYESSKQWYNEANHLQEHI
ncbi:mediator complex subunit 31 isoform X3 [Andrena cerasifolii]|uniref:mediator complex subunit 31 isoform X3 n=1 Tax=Andrena cerasifolii TaxID=2819439 RepID=UPI004037D5ED